MNFIVSSQADEPIADYAAMDDVYQGKWYYRHLQYNCYISIVEKTVIQTSYRSYCSLMDISSFTVRMPEEGFKGEHSIYLFS